MNDPEKSNPAQAQSFITMMIALSMIMSVAIFGFLSWQNAQNPRIEAVAEPKTQMFAIIAGIVGMMSFILPMILTPKGPKRDETGKKVLNPAAFFVPAVMSFALSEAVGIMGFLASQETNNFEIYLPFGVCAGLLLLIHGFRFVSKIKATQKQII